ncbi:MAG TPA: right-handed parallel beta-helix repeat-containing protein [Candidatus Hydrogenedentes bacterium]|nr:right-handed parallel beta-helix repeat-containing protein [Candidatus Hydrogenedentota bacterium]
MCINDGKDFDRRTLLRFAAAGLAGSLVARAQIGPEVTSPRATSGDYRIEPEWEQRAGISVGPADADIIGTGEKAIQAAVDYVTRLGGGTVTLKPGTYRLRNSVFLPSNIRLVGSGIETILLKEPSVETKLSIDSDWYDQEITLQDPTGFRVGDGVCLRTTSPHDGGQRVLKRTLIAQSGNRFKLDKALRENFWIDQEPTATTVFPLLTAEYAKQIQIEHLALDGNKDNNAYLDGNYGGCIWFQDCSDLQIRGVTARNNNGDGISWQICHDVMVENCHSHDNKDLGMHPGSGSQRPIIVGNRLERNGIGLFFCWGVKYGLAERNYIADNRDYGISIGHRDDENLVRDNDVLRSGKSGLLFRPERGEGYTAKGNRFEKNRFIDSGGDDGVGIDVQGVTASNFIQRNVVKESRGPASRVGIRIGKECGANEISENQIEGYSSAVQDLRTA